MTPRQAFPPIRLAARALVGGRLGRRVFGPLDLELAPGEAIELRGANGAGKSTLLMTLAGLIPSLSGAVEMSGDDPHGPGPFALFGHRNAIRARLTLSETLAFFAALDGARAPDIAGALEAVGLARLADRDAGQLSQGQQRRLGFARLLVAPRPVWLLDEPTAGLDDEGEHRLARLIEAHLAEGGSAVIATHLDLPLAASPRRITLGSQA